MLIEMSEADLLARLRNHEDQFVERKTIADLNDCLKTVVAFANSAPIGAPCILYVGVRDDGRFEEKEKDFDRVQKSLNKLLQKIYPAVPYFPKLITDGSQTALAVIVPGSGLRPHFSGPSYIRRGSETFEASQIQLEELIASRNGKIYRLSQNIGKYVTAINHQVLGNGTFTRGNWATPLKVIQCNELWATFEQGANPAFGQIQPSLYSFAIRDIELSYDHGAGRVEVELTRRTGF